MNFKQLKCVCEIDKCKLNISMAAEALFTNQPGVSKQLKLLEDELGFEIFERRRNRLIAVTPQGARFIVRAQNILNETQSIRRMSEEYRDGAVGPLVVAATETQAHYFLPRILRKFSVRYPKIRVTMRHAEPGRVVEMLRTREADLGITTQANPNANDIITLPCLKAEKIVIVPKNHELTKLTEVNLRDIASYPLITYDPGFTPGNQVLREFQKQGLLPEFAVTAISADVIKSCVSEGLGIGILSSLTFNEKLDVHLSALPAGHLFEPSTTSVFLSRHLYLSKFIYDFLELCGSQWTRHEVQTTMRALGD